MDLYSTERAGVIEMLGRLVGTTTWREPMEGHSTKLDHLPKEHALEAALSFGRRHRNDTAPDLLAAVATRTEIARTKIVPELVAALRIAAGRVAERNTEHLLVVAAHAYLQVVYGTEQQRPAFVSMRDYELLVSFGCRLLWAQVASTARRVHRAFHAAA